jgi:hypothetical protein
MAAGNVGRPEGHRFHAHGFLLGVRQVRNPVRNGEAMSGAKPESILTVGPIPMRKGFWLGRQRGSSWEPLAKFRSEEAADEFVSIMRKLGAAK